MRGAVTSCTAEGTAPVHDGDRVAMGVGNPGAPFDRIAGQGRFLVTYSFTVTPQ